MSQTSWNSYEALQDTICSNSEEIAKALIVSASMCRKWKEPPNQSGTRNPLDRIAIMISTIEKIDSDRAYIPIKWLCDRFGFFPPIKMPNTKGTDEGILKAILNWNKEFGETCKEVSQALEDGEITDTEYKRCHKEFLEVVEAGMTLLSKMAEQKQSV